jgi:hypothetical protein
MIVGKAEAAKAATRLFWMKCRRVIVVLIL